VCLSGAGIAGAFPDTRGKVLNRDYRGYGNYFNEEQHTEWEIETRKNRDGHKNEDERRGKKARAWNDAEEHTSFPIAFGDNEDYDSAVGEEKGASTCGKADNGSEGSIGRSHDGEYDKHEIYVDELKFKAEYILHEFEADYDSDEVKKFSDSVISAPTSFLRFSDNENDDGSELEGDQDSDDEINFEADDGDDDKHEFEADYDSDEENKVSDHRSDDNCGSDNCSDSVISAPTRFLRFSVNESDNGSELEGDHDSDDEINFEADDDDDDEHEFEADYDSDEEMKISDHRSDDNCGSDKCSVISAPRSFLRFSDNENDDKSEYEGDDDSDDEINFQADDDHDDEHESESDCDSGEDSKVDDHADQLNAIKKPMSKREATSSWRSNNGNGHIKFVKKNKRGQSGNRYSKYKKGATPNECLKLGATPQDLTWDIQKENAVMVRENIVGNDLL